MGHNTGRCQFSAYDAARIIQRRVRGFEDDGMIVLQTQSGIPLYTNLIRGLHDHGDSESSSDGYFDATLDFQQQ